jgi:signal peptidase I
MVEMLTKKEKFKQYAKKTYDFIFNDNSAWSWIVNIILAFIIVKFIIYPFLSLILGTSLPLVAVISGSMEHNGQNFDTWWEDNKEWYEENDISKEKFETFKIKNGFNKGDVIILANGKDPKLGDTLVYLSGQHKYPIIHRVTYIKEEQNTYQLKGDNNQSPDSIEVEEDMVLGKAVMVIPKIGWVKIWFSELLGL